MSDEKAGLTGLGKLFSFLLIVALFAVGGYVVYTKFLTKPALKPDDGKPITQNPDNKSTAAGTGKTAALQADEVVPAKDSVDPLGAAVPFIPKDGVIVIELSEYAGYSGLIVANGGLEPNPDSIFSKKYGLKVRLTLSEDESWSKLNSGAIAGSATTADVLAVYGKQLAAIVPAQIGFSRGADGLVVRKDIRRVNQLKGQTIAAAQFNETDFFTRYLTQEAGLAINVLTDLNSPKDPDKLNVVYCADAFGACDLFARDLANGTNILAGCMTWDPKTTETAQGSDGKAHVMVTNKNLLIIADVLILNKPWATANPAIVKSLVAGMLEGNRLVRKNPEAQIPVIVKAFNSIKKADDKDSLWDAAKTRRELAKVHLSNLPENLAFFGGTIDSAGSFAGIYQMAVLAYGNIIKNPVDSDFFASLAALQALDKEGFGANDTIEIAPIRTAKAGSLENDPLLSKDIRFFFLPNSADLDMDTSEKNLSAVQNLKNLAALQQMLKISPGSTILLRGHVDPGNIEKFRKQGGDTFVREMALKAMDLSKQRAAAVRKAMLEKYQTPSDRLNVVGRGWEEPSGTDMEKNRRVEAQWFTVE